MFAVFESGGKQHRVVEGEVVRLEKLDGEPGDEVVFRRVLMIADGDRVSVGTPLVAGGAVAGRVVQQGLGKKVRVVKFKRRKDYLRQKGHRQPYTDVRITQIAPGVGG